MLDPDRPEGRTWDNAGQAEDVAAGPAVGYLLHHGVRPAGEPLLVHQGRLTGRPSTIEVRPGPDGTSPMQALQVHAQRATLRCERSRMAAASSQHWLPRPPIGATP